MLYLYLSLSPIRQLPLSCTRERKPKNKTRKVRRIPSVAIITAKIFSGTTLEKTLKTLSNISVEQFLMIALFVLILIGDFKKVGNGAVVGVVDR